MALIVILGERKFKKCFRKGENIFQKELNVLSNGRDVSLIESAFLGLPLFLLALSGPAIRNLLGFFVLPACPSKFNYLFNIEFTEYNKGFLPFPNQAP